MFGPQHSVRVNGAEFYNLMSTISRAADCSAPSGEFKRIDRKLHTVQLPPEQFSKCQDCTRVDWSTRVPCSYDAGVMAQLYRACDPSLAVGTRDPGAPSRHTYSIVAIGTSNKVLYIFVYYERNFLLCGTYVKMWKQLQRIIDKIDKTIPMIGVATEKWSPLKHGGGSGQSSTLSFDLGACFQRGYFSMQHRLCGWCSQRTSSHRCDVVCRRFH